MKAKSSAVSPVVGVMLMLVVTVIIAAVVTAFAGGMTSDNDVINAQIRATYSQSNGIEIENIGGDAIPTMTTTVLIYPTKTFGNAEHHIYTVNKSTIFATRSGGSPWLNTYGSTGTKSFNPGDTNYIIPPYHTAEFLQPQESYSSYKFDYSGNLGKTFWLELVDDSGSTIAKTKVIIES